MKKYWKTKAKSLIIGVIFCLCAGLMTSCHSAGASEKKATEKEDDTFRIVTSFYPLYIMVMNLTDGIDGVEIDNMAEPQTGCLHDYQLRPGDLVSLEGADVFLANGGGMEEFLSDVLDTYPSLTILYALDALEFDELLPGEEHAHDGHAHEDEEKEEAQHALEEGESVGTVESGEINPHTWLNPVLYKKELQYLSAALGERNPENKDRYEENRQAYEKKIDALLAEYEDLQGITEKEGCVLLHESFAYLADAYGFPVLETIDVEKDSGFSAKEIRNLIDMVQEAGNGLLLSDSQYSGRISALLSTETGMEVYQLDSCVSGEYEKDAWLNSMRKNLEELRNAAN